MTAVAVVAIVSVWVSSSAAVTSNPVVAVQVNAFSVFPATQGAPKGKVKFIVTNTGTFKHEFVVLKTAKPAGNLLKGKEADEAGNVGEIGGIPAGQAKTLTLTLEEGPLRPDLQPARPLRGRSVRRLLRAIGSESVRGSITRGPTHRAWLDNA